MVASAAWLDRRASGASSGSWWPLAAVAACDGKMIHLGDGRDGGVRAHAQVNADEVLWIGDSWILIPGSQHTRVRDSARVAGAIGPNDDYVIGAAPATTMAAIANQYAAQEAGATKVKVADHGRGHVGHDRGDELGQFGDASVSSAASAFSQFLAQVASDGTVEHIIYFLTPELSGIPGVAALRPLAAAGLRREHGAVPLPRPAAALGRPPRIHRARRHPRSDRRRRASPSRDAIWALMQQRCIAQ